jgi:hypothetical protein
MPKTKRPDSAAISRLKVLAAGDETAFHEHVIALIESGDRLAREAAVAALVDRPSAAIRERLRALYFELDADGSKHDPGAHVRVNIVRVLLALSDVRDGDIGVRATDTYETVMGTDGTANLRALGLKLLAAVSPDVFPYIAAEHVGDASEFSPEPANTALQLLSGAGHSLAVYQWLRSWRPTDSALLAAGLDLLSDVPSLILSRAVAGILDGALARDDEWLLTAVAETIVKRELADAYPSLDALMNARISDELYGYVAMLLAGTNRPALLSILDEQMDDMRRRSAVVAALRIRTTPEQAAILKKWDVD